MTSIRNQDDPGGDMDADEPMEFEALVGDILRGLASNHRQRVSVRPQPKFRLQNGQLVIPDYELVYDLPHQRDRRLIECQDRKRYDQGLAQRIRQIKSLSRHNRFIFVHPEKEGLPEAVCATLDGDGIVVYNLEEFGLFIDHLDATLSKLEELDRDEIAREGKGLAQATYWMHLRKKYETFLKRGAVREADPTTDIDFSKLRQSKSKKAARSGKDTSSWYKDEGMLAKREPSQNLKPPWH